MAKILNWAQNEPWAAMCPYRSVRVRRIFIFYVFVRYNTCTRIVVIIIRIFIRIYNNYNIILLLSDFIFKRNIFSNLNLLDARVASRDWFTDFYKIF